MPDMLHRLRHLRCAPTRETWASRSRQKMPYKPLLLLSVIDLIETRAIRTNLVPISTESPELVETFNGYLWKVFPENRSGSIALPFYHMEKDIWELVPRQGVQQEQPKSVPMLTRMVLGARLLPELFESLKKNDFRERVRQILLETYFVPEVHPVILGQSRLNVKAGKYARAIQEGGGHGEGNSDYELDCDFELFRDPAFRHVLVRVYEHRCATCGLRLVAPNGHTVVEAAHIVPWSETHDDRIVNGMALCRLCHWTFDEGLMTLGNDYTISVSGQVRSIDNVTLHVESLHRKEMLRPRDIEFWPDASSLAWHREKIFQK